MSSPVNPSFLQFDGEPIGGRVPAQVLVRGPDLTGAQQAAVGKLYANFCAANRLGLGAYAAHTATLPDGTRVRLESNTGVDRIIVWTSGGSLERYDLRPLMIYASTDAPFGVDPSDPQEPVIAPRFDTTKAVSKWVSLPLVDGQPIGVAHGVRSLYDGARLGGSFPGTMDWYDGREGSPFYGLVLSWWSIFPSRYQSEGNAYTLMFHRDGVTDAVMSKQQTLGGAIYGMSKSRSYSGGSVDIPEWAAGCLWCNGETLGRIPAGHVVLSACLCFDEDRGAIVRVLASSSWAFGLDGWQLSNPNAMTVEIVCYEASASIDAMAKSGGTRLTFERVWSFSDRPPLHAPHCNASGTRAVYLRRKMGNADSRANSFQEIDLASGERETVATPFSQNPTTVVTPPATTSFDQKIDNGDYSAHTFSTFLRSYSHTSRWMMSADYRLDELEYVYLEESRTSTLNNSVARQKSGSQLPLGGHTYTLTDTSSSLSEFSASTTIRHNLIGELKTVTWGQSILISHSGAGTFTQEVTESGSGQDLVTTTVTSATGSATTSKTTTYPGEIGSDNLQAVGIDGDLRVRSFDLFLVHGNEWEETGSYSYSCSVGGANTTVTYADGRPTTSSGQIMMTMPVDTGDEWNGAPTREYELMARFVGGVEQEPDPDDEHFGRRIGMELASDDPSTIQYRTYEGSDVEAVVFSSPISEQTIDFRSDLVDYGYPMNGVCYSRILGSTSSFDGKLYYTATMRADANMQFYAAEITSLTMDATVYHIPTLQPVADLNAAGLNPCPGEHKSCTTLMFLGPIRDDSAGRFVDRPEYFYKEPIL